MKIILSALECENAELSILITNDKEIRQINKKWLKRDRPANVIAFSQIEGLPFPTDFIGDVVISIETADRQAREFGHSLERELERLLVHGILHLFGYDHVHGGRQAKKMAEREQQLAAMIRAAESEK